MKTSKHQFENLVFEGGGVKGAVYAGCIQVLSEHGLYDQVKRVAGTSAGSITAALLAVGAGKEGLTDSILHSNFNQFVYDKGGWFMDIFRLFRCYGIHTGDSFAKILKGYIGKYGGNPNLTFAQLEAKIKAQQNTEEPNKYKHLSVVASNITTQQVTTFNAKNTPDLPIWKAVRCSMSIPIVFEPFVIDDNYYVDGGLGWIYPIDMYDEKKPDGEDIRNPKTLGFYLEPQNQINNPGFQPSKTDIHSVKSAAQAMIGFLYNNANARHFHPGDKARTVFVDDLGVDATDFSISKAMIKKLIASGRKATEAYLK